MTVRVVKGRPSSSLLSIMRQRKVQAFVIYDPITNQNYTTGGTVVLPSDEPDVPPPARPTTLAVCSQATDNVVSYKTVVTFQYTVETNQKNVTSTTIKDDIPLYVGGAMIEALAPRFCPDIDDDDGSSSSSSSTSYTTSTSTKDTTSSSSNSPIISPNCTLTIGSGSQDKYLTTCTPTESKNLSKSCFLYEGTIQIAHTDECSEDDIIDGTLAVLNTTVDTKDFVTGINTRRESLEPSDPVVLTDVDIRTKHSPTENQTIAGIATYESKSANSNAFPIMALVLLGLIGLVLLFLVIVYCWYRKRQAELERRKELKSLERKKAFDDDVKSIKTDWSAGCGGGPPGGSNLDDSSYVKPDFHDLGLVHKTVDVHVCRSPLCPICTIKDIGKVTMVPVQESRFVGTPGAMRKQRTPRSRYCKDDADDEQLTLATLESPPLDEDDNSNTAPLEHNRLDAKNDDPPMGAVTMTVIRNLSLFDQAEQQQQQHQAPPETAPTRSVNFDDDDIQDDVKYVRRSRWDWARGNGNANNATGRATASSSITTNTDSGIRSLTL